MTANRNTIRALRLRVAGVALGAAALVGGCVSLDHTADVEQASALVTARSATEPGWTTPWFEPSDAWDGRSPLSPDVAVRVALQGNRAIRAEVESITASRADFVQAHLLPNPVINFAYGFPTDGLGGEPLAVAAVQQLAWIWRRPAAIDSADARLRARILAVSDAALRLVAETRSAHADVAHAEHGVALQEQNVDLHERSTGLLREQLAVGEASRLDVDRGELALRAAEVSLADRRVDLDRAKRRLLELLGRAEASADWQTAGADRLVETNMDAMDEQQVIRLAGSQRLDVAAAEAGVAAQAATVNLAESGRIPDVSAGVGYEQNFSDRAGVFPSVSVTPKLFDDNSARIAKAESGLRRAQIEADGVRQKAIAEARQAWVALETQLVVVTSYRSEIVALAERTLDLAQAAFDAGEDDLTVLLEAQRDLNGARLELTDRERSAAGLLFELERATGGSLATQPPIDVAIRPETTP